MIKAFIFDIGGVLVKNDEAIMDAIAIALQENGIKLKNREEIFHVFGRSNYINVKTAVEISYSGKNTREKIDSCFESFENIFPKKVLGRFELMPHVLETLKKLKNTGVRLAVFTGLNKNEAKHSLKYFGIMDFFEFVITIDNVKKPRPDPEAILKAIKKMDVKKDECIYVGDTIADIQMAKNSGIRIVCVKTGVQYNKILEKENPDYFVEDLSEMLMVLSDEIEK